MYKAYVFDLDGTIIDSLVTIAECFNGELKKIGYKPIENELYKYLVGDGSKILTERAVDHIIERDGLNINDKEREELINKLHNSYLNSYNSMDDDFTKVYDGVRESLSYLKSKGALLAVCTNKPEKAAYTVIENNFGREYFDYIIGVEDDDNRKPNPFMMERLMEALKLKKEDIAYFGDTSTDMMTAKNVDVFGVGVTWGFREEDELIQYGADKIIHSPLEIKEV